MTKRTQNILIPVFGTAAFILAAVLVVVLFWPKIQAMISEKTGKTAGIDGIGEISYYETPEEHIATDENGFMYADNEMLVVVRDGTSRRAAEKLAKKYNAEIVGCIEATGDYQWLTNRTYTKEELHEIFDQIENEPDVLQVAINYINPVGCDSVEYDINIGTDSKWKNDLKNSTDKKGVSWGIEAIKAPEVWTWLNQNKSTITPVRIGLIDNGFDTTHKDLDFERAFYNNSVEWHGTLVAGIMAATANDETGICGVYPFAKNNLFAVSSNGVTQARGNSFTLYSSMYQKISFAELILRNVKVINSSENNLRKRVNIIEHKKEDWKDYLEHLNDNADILGEFLNRLLTKGYDFVIVSAAGNSSEGEETNLESAYNSFLNAVSEDKYPEVYQRIIVVGALNKEYEIADYSNAGTRVDIFAPGDDIYGTLPGDKYGYEYKLKYGFLDDLLGNGGTSFSSPIVAGAAATVWSINNNLNGAAVKVIITQSIDVEHEDPGMLDFAMAARAAFRTRDHTSTEPIINPENGSILGFVVDTEQLEVKENTITDGAIENAEVIIKNADTGKETASVKTDAGGHFEAILPAGTYRLTVKAPNYLTEDWSKDVVVRNGEVTYLDDWVKMTFFPYVEATDADFDALGRDFSADSCLSDLSPTFYTLKDGVFTASFNSDQMDTGDFRKYCFFMTTSLLYERYFKSERVTLENDDPFSGDMLKSNHRYIRYSEENLRWLAKHVLNMTQPFDREEFLAGDSTTCQFHEGYYYFPEIGYDLDRDPWAKIDSYEQIDESSYEIKITYEFNYNGERSDAVGEGTLLAGVKEVDGKRIWSFYQYNASVRHAQNEKTALVKAAPGSYTFSSGAGSWATSLTLNDDWTFKGEFHDYNATGIYVCSFTGSFSKPERVSDYCYSMKLLSLDYEPAGREYYENNMLHITAEPHGLVGGTEFLLYLPGMPLSETAEGFRSWRGHFGASLENASALPSNLYGLYNVTKEYPFFKALN